MNLKIRLIGLFGFSLSAVFSTVLCVAQTARALAPAPKGKSLFISTSDPWTDTGIDIPVGNMLTIRATSTPSSAAMPDRHAIPSAGCDPQGVSSASASNLPVSDALPGALIAKLQPQGVPFLVGARKELRISESGHLFLGVNAEGVPPCVGNIIVTVRLEPVTTAGTPATNATPTAAQAATTPAQQTPAQPQDIKSKLRSAYKIWLSGQLGNDNSQQSAAATPGIASGTPATAASSATPSNVAVANAAPLLTVSATPLDSFFRQNIDGLPRRVNDQYQNLGDMVNFVLVGSDAQVQSALETANWHVADTNTTEAGVKAVFQTIEKKDYLQMPMSQLYLFGRVQDFGYEQAEPYAVVASRHHFRIWKAPFTWNGQTVWVGAGTHDVGFEKDQRNGKITHKIDPAVDGERDNIGASLQKAEQVKSLHYYLPPEPVQEARNATGGGYHSDGRVLVIFLK